VAAQRLVAWQGVRTQAGIGVAQFCFAVISLAVLTLPDIPAYNVMQRHIVTVIVLRKVLRLVIIATLCWVAYTAARTRRHVYTLLDHHKPRPVSRF
jgi:hypothetical protein